MHFESPWAFILLLLIPFLIGFRYYRIKGPSIQFSAVGNSAKSGKSLRMQLSWLPIFIRVVALILFIVALARPQTGKEEIKQVSKGIAIEMVVDRSSSMGAEFEYRGEHVTRLDAVKNVFEEFVLGGGNNLHGRPNDLVGMITFARYADTVCPLTLAHGALPAFLKSIKLVQIRDEDGTAIGDALALAAARLQTADESLKRQQDKADSYKIKSKIIVLLSDGQNNCGERSPLQAAELAEKWGIKVYTIAIGGGEAVTTIRTPLGTYKVPIGGQIDTSTLKAVAEKTGGFFRTADDSESLQQIYEEIDKMEKTEIESVRFIDYKEFFTPFALIGLILIIFEIMLQSIVFRSIP